MPLPPLERSYTRQVLWMARCRVVTPPVASAMNSMRTLATNYTVGKRNPPEPA